MTLTEGTFELGPEKGQILVRTGRSGFGRRAGHDLTLEAAGWSGTAVVAGAAGSSVEVTVRVGELKVREGTGGVLPLSAQDRDEITKNLRTVLKADAHPEITFRSTGVAGTADAFTVEGDLTIAGRTERVTLRASSREGRVRGSAIVRQTRWGIKPYSAFFGALKLADDVEVSVDLEVLEL
ncbi:YceI family protein [Spirillospora sp. CA-294931]|uniref:YceI family protein n=1 Tax=Spirillospora sp. CA-294931 TaxID=3240042 RepID=UPI003D8B265A